LKGFSNYQNSIIDNKNPYIKQSHDSLRFSKETSNVVQGSTAPQIPRKETPSNFINIDREVKKAKETHDINDLIAEMNANGEFEGQLSELTGTSPEKTDKATKSLQNGGAPLYQHHTDREPSMINLIATDAPSTKAQDKKQNLQLP